jgi:hypothetical protein
MARHADTMPVPPGQESDSKVPEVTISELTAPSDTTRWGEDDDDAEDLPEPTRKNIAKGFNALDYILENRFVPEGETFTRKFTDHMYLQFSLGGEKILAPPSVDYGIEMLTIANLGVGKQLDKRNTLRLTFNLGVGYQRNLNMAYKMFDVKFDHMYSLSSYMAGYNPSRLLDVSSLFGFGIRYNSMLQDKKTVLEGHTGLHLKFYTGPHAYVFAEPYIGMGGDQMDLSDKRNWRGLDFFYGANVGLIYYIDNNLSTESRLRLINQRRAHNELSNRDSLLMSWQQPWFAQLSTGIAWMGSQRLSLWETTGSEISATIGKWLSPVVGFRGTLTTRNTPWIRVDNGAHTNPYHPAYSEMFNNSYRSARIEGMLNPMGFLPRFDWNAPWGFYLMGGMEVGWLNKRQWDRQHYDILNTKCQAYSLGANVWWQPTHGLKLFVEPRYSHLVYRIPYANAEWYGRYSDHNVSVNFGIAMETRDTKHWHKEPSYTYLYEQDPLHMLTFGLGGGTNLMQTASSVEGGNDLGFDGLFFGEYHFDRMMTARLGVEFLSLRRTSSSPYIDYNMETPKEGYSPVYTEGLWDHRYNLLAISPGFQANLNQLLFGYQSSPIKLHGFLGPTLLIRMKTSSIINKQERVMMHHYVQLDMDQSVRLHFGAHLGLKLDYRINKHLGAWFAPTFYWISNTKLPGVNFTYLKFVETFNIGVQYNLFEK